MDLSTFDPDQLRPDNGLLAKRLLPWTTLNAPFEGAWCVVRPGTASTRHAHHEYEIFIAVSGEAVLESEGERAAFAAGDVAYFPPGTDHRVVNDGAADFEMYGIWWDADMTGAFTARHEQNHERDAQEER
ncbi:cupin [Planomonospora sphaerica]|uniref:Cupin n=3 Tax=Planomonospora TaxID=1998 RepID=A0A171DNR7_9ACTN|nr:MULTISPECIES: cupin domain-containing protein [Planomonospora]GAT70702.1 cupin [Planomonospora sphaerica]GGK92949.1 cupin [Planomonospora parontospora]GII12088.1 cupin [Planomonospora parontospora subsp. parontospora]